MSEKELSRRAFVHATGGAALLVAAGCKTSGGTGLDDTSDTSETGGTGGSGQVVEVDLYCGTVDKTWTFAPTDGSASVSYDVRMRGYGNTPGGLKVPGPTVAFSPGDTLKVTLYNVLPKYDNTGYDEIEQGYVDDGLDAMMAHNVPHGLDHTNLHVHGLEVIPHLFGMDDPGGELLLGTDAVDSMMFEFDRADEADVQGRTYVFEIPANHPTGLFWYHPHKHGSTGVQAVTGMAGGILVNGGIDNDEIIQNAQDELLVCQDIGLGGQDDDGRWYYEPEVGAIYQAGKGATVRYPRAGGDDPKTTYCSVDDADAQGFSYGDYPLRFYLVNGEPVYRETHNDEDFESPIGTQGAPAQISAVPGKVVRVRMLNGNSDLVMPLVLVPVGDAPDLPIHLVALDGVNFDGAPMTFVTRDADGDWDGVLDYNFETMDNPCLVLAGGNRAEFLLQYNGTADATYQLISLSTDGQQLLVTNAKVIAEITFSGTPDTTTTPEKLAAYTMTGCARHFDSLPTAASGPTPQLDVPFAMRVGPAGDGDTCDPGSGSAAQTNRAIGADFGIGTTATPMDPVLYQMNRIDWEVQLNDVGEIHAWSQMDEGHPFHIHTNAVMLTDIGDIPQPAGIFLDVVWCPPPLDTGVRKVKMLTRFQTWPGKAVYHCHILPHEDTGMMGNMNIVTTLP